MKNAVVTGHMNGMGKGAYELLKQKGYNVIGWDISGEGDEKVDVSSAKDVAEAAAEGAALMAIQANDPRITLVAGGYPLFAGGRIAGGIGVGGGSEAQDCEIAEYVVSVFNEMMK